MKVGITATRAGLTPAQEFKLGSWLSQNPVVELHHGDCLGGDARAHDIGKRLGFLLVGHPPTNSSQRAFCVVDKEREPKPYLDRNHDIVDETDILIALPKTAKEELRSGTWATIRYATRQGKCVIIIPGDINGSPTED